MAPRASQEALRNCVGLTRPLSRIPVKSPASTKGAMSEASIQIEVGHHSLGGGRRQANQAHGEEHQLVGGLDRLGRVRASVEVGHDGGASGVEGSTQEPPEKPRDAVPDRCFAGLEGRGAQVPHRDRNDRDAQRPHHEIPIQDAECRHAHQHSHQDPGDDAPGRAPEDLSPQCDQDRSRHEDPGEVDHPRGVEHGRGSARSSPRWRIRSPEIPESGQRSSRWRPPRPDR
jgi:hypothetical protein